MNISLNVLYFSSDLFVDVAASSIVSLLENNKSFEDIKIYVIDDGISNEKCELLRKWWKTMDENWSFCQHQTQENSSNFHLRVVIKWGIPI